MIIYKMDVLQALKDAGFTSYRMRKDKLIGERTMQQIRNKELVSWATVDTICSLLNCQPGDIVEHVKESETK